MQQIVNRKATEDVQQQIWRMFDRVARRYDFLNHLLSAGRDIYWRKQMVQQIARQGAQKILDLACGSGDVLLTILKEYPRCQYLVGVDASRPMLALAREKISSRNSPSLVHLIAGDARKLPFPENSFDALTIAFGIRNVPQMEQALSEMFRVVQPGGKIYILEFSLPRSPLIRPFYLIYFRHLLPLIGGLLSGDATAYRYLNQSVETFPAPEKFRELLEKYGFKNITFRSLTGGVVTLYTGERP